MSDKDRDDDTTYRVVVNHEEQYSIWPADREKPLGWKDEGKQGTRADCLAHIKEVWTDMRPLSLRRQMAAREARPAEAAAPRPPEEPIVGPTRDALVNRLCAGRHPVKIVLRPESTIRGLKECLDRKYVHVQFTDTRGGTELGVRLDSQTSDWGSADFDAGTGQLHLEGNLVLNFIPVRCVADISVESFAGEGCLQPQPGAVEIGRMSTTQ